MADQVGYEYGQPQEFSQPHAYVDQQERMDYQAHGQHRCEAPPVQEGMFKAQAWYSISGACLESVVDWRNDSYRSAESTLAGKSLSYLTTELVAVAIIPVAVIEGIVRLAVSTLAYLVDVLGCIKPGEEENDTWYDCFKAGHVFALLAGIKAVHLGIANLNPWNTEIRLNDAADHFPVVSGVLNLDQVSAHFNSLGGGNHFDHSQ